MALILCVVEALQQVFLTLSPMQESFLSIDILVLQGFAPYNPLPLSQSLPPNLLSSSILSKDLAPLLLAITSGMAIGVLDGSYMPQKYPHLATAGWILLDATCFNPSICCGVSQVPDQASYINLLSRAAQSTHSHHSNYFHMSEIPDYKWTHNCWMQ